jgi:hypothetical protein
VKPEQLKRKGEEAEEEEEEEETQGQPAKEEQ